MVTRKKIAFFIDNSEINSLKIISSKEGNPGIGGTHFMFITIAEYLNQREGYECYVLSPFPETLPQINSIQCENISEISSICKRYELDYLILRGPIFNESEKKIIEEINCKIITWSHNFEDYKSIQIEHDLKNIVCNVCVSRQQLDRLIDTKLYSKSVLIFNTVNDVTVRKNVFSKNLRICYVGSTDKKRFLRVKDIWKQLRKQKVKNIEFHVIGGDNLYNTSNRNDIPYYCDKEEIFYHGIVGGAEKIELMKTMNLGIIFSKRETFGLASIEFQALGIPVVALKSYGMIDTIIDKKTGFLVNNKYQAIRTIKKISQNPLILEELSNHTFSFINNNFSRHIIVDQWVSLFEYLEVYEQINNKLDLKKIQNKSKNFKWLRILNYKLHLPSLLFYKYYIKKIIIKIRDIL